MTRNTILASVLFGLGIQTSVLADIINVPGDQPTIQEAIDAASDGDEVVVAPGTYNEAISLLGKAITLRSSDGPEVTTIDANGSDTVVRCDGWEGPETVITGFTITGGKAEGGGGMYNFGTPTVTHCRFIGNHAKFGGGGMYNEQGSSARVINCTFNGNSAPIGGGMYNCCEASPKIINCTLANNNADLAGGIFNSGPGTNPMVINTILWGNESDQIVDEGSAATIVMYSDVQGGWSGAGSNNMDLNPFFVDADGPDGIPGTQDDDLRLVPYSPCVDAGISVAIKFDLDRNIRIVAHALGPDRGLGFPAIIDMGAYEAGSARPCPADLNGNGLIDAFDLAVLLGAWGACQK